MKRVSFPFPPMPAPRPRFGKGRARMSERYMAWKREVRIFWGADTPRRRCIVTITLREWKSRADLDNYAKAILDALAGVAYVDDCCEHVREVHVRCLAGASGSFLASGFQVEVEEVEDEKKLRAPRGPKINVPVKMNPWSEWPKTIAAERSHVWDARKYLCPEE